MIANVEADSGLILSGLGLSYRVDDFYAVSRHSDEPVELPAALTDLLASLLSETKP